MGVRYRRKSNFFGWLAFFLCGATIFGGLIFALMFFKEHAEEKEKKAKAALPQTDHPTLGKPAHVVVTEQLKKLYAKEGKNMDAPRFGDPKEVQSQKNNRAVVIIMVQHRESGSEGDYTSDIFVLDRTNIKKVSAKDWPKVKVDLGITDDPPAYTKPEE